MQTLQPPRAPPNQARLVVTPESTLEFGQILGSGAFGTVHEVCVVCVCVCVCVCVNTFRTRLVIEYGGACTLLPLVSYL